MTQTITQRKKYDTEEDCINADSQAKNELSPPITLIHHLRAEQVPYGLRLKGIYRGYRYGGNVKECLWSLFSWNNQTLNSWTMIWGWMLSSCFLYYTVQKHKPQGWDLTPFISLWLGPTCHLPFTVGYHQLLCISQEHLRWWRSLDLIFIFVASAFFTYSLCYFVFPFSVTSIISAVAVTFAVIAWHTAHHLPAGADINKGANTGFVGLAIALYLAPLMYESYSSLGQGLVDTVVLTTIGAVASLFFSAVVYVRSIPDVWFPGLFDYVGAAQQFMHIGVTSAHVFEWICIMHLFQRNSNGGRLA